MKLIPLKVPPGFARKGTAYSQQGRWRDGNLVRFSEASVRPVGGWSRVSLTTTGGDSTEIVGTVRSMLSWKDNLGRAWTAIGTTRKLYVLEGSRLYDITPADLTAAGESPGVQLGYGTGNYNTGNYSEPVGVEGEGNASGSATVYGYWHLDNFGENLVATLDSDGRIFEWSPNTPSTAAAVIANAPEFVRGIVVTTERHMVAIGAKEVVGLSDLPRPRRVQWSNVEDNTDWTPAVDSAAGENELQDQDGGIRCLRFRNETLILTGTGLHRLNYVGYPFFYVLERVAGDCGIANPGAVSMNANLLFWVSPRGFFAYDGNQVQPVESDLFNTPGDIAALLAVNGRTAVGHNELHNEFWIFYSTEPNENPSRYIAWSYKRNWWVDGDLDRSCWYDSDVDEYPLATQPYAETGIPKSRLFIHEVGSQRPNYSGGQEYIQSAPIEMGDGDSFLHVDRVIQDSDINEGARLRVGFEFYRAPNLSPMKTIAAKPLDAVRGYTDVRGCGRAMSISISTDTASNGDWRVGNWRVSVVEDGGR